MLPWNPPSAFSLAGGANSNTAGGQGYSPYADSQMSQQQHQQQSQQLHHQQQGQMQSQQQQGGGQGQQGPNGAGGGAPAQGSGPPANQNSSQTVYPPMTLASTLHFLQSEHRRYARDRNEWEIERAEMRARIALLEGEKRGNEGALKSLARRCKMLEMALRGERSKFLTSTAAAAAAGGPGGLNPASLSSAALGSAAEGASPALSGTASPIPGAGPTLASTTAGSSIAPNKALTALQQTLSSSSPVSTPGVSEAPKSIPMTTSTSSPGQAAGLLSTGPPGGQTQHTRSDSVGAGSAANGYQSGTWAAGGGTSATSASGHGPSLVGGGGLRDPRGKARSREYLKQCLQEITYLTSSATLNPLAAHSYAAPGVPRPRKVLPDQVPVSAAAGAGGSTQPGIINLAPPATTSLAASSGAPPSAAQASAPVPTPTTNSSVVTSSRPSDPGPGSEFEPVAASSVASLSSGSAPSLAAATPVEFPSAAATAAEPAATPSANADGTTPSAAPGSEPDVFASTPVPAVGALSNGLSPTTGEVSEQAEDDEDEEEREGSDPPSAFVPLDRQTSRGRGAVTVRSAAEADKSTPVDAADRAQPLENGDGAVDQETNRAVAEMTVSDAATASDELPTKSADSESGAITDAKLNSPAPMKEDEQGRDNAGVVAHGSSDSPSAAEEEAEISTAAQKAPGRAEEPEATVVSPVTASDSDRKDGPAVDTADAGSKTTATAKKEVCSLPCATTLYHMEETDLRLTCDLYTPDSRQVRLDR